MRATFSVAEAGLKDSGQPALTELASGAGCGCKLPAASLLALLRGLPAPTDERLLVGASTGDDAAVFRLREDMALVQTIDFFTPLVDDPYDFGRIAAANALSDVYAMGATPLLALNVVAFPLEGLGAAVLAEILRGGQEVVSQAGAVLAGGHSIDDPQPKYGLAVSGLVDPRHIVTNAAARPGDSLVLTKPLGVGAIVAARRRGAATGALLGEAVATMVQLNRDAARAACAAGVHAMTDVTGFGLLGHLHHVCRESGLAAELVAHDVPALAGVRELLESGAGTSGGSERNAAWASEFTTFDAAVPAWRRSLLADATTSGGLLAALPPAAAGAVPGAVVGRLHAGTPGSIHVR
jgi:selenide, water dikinase